jgi:hypothetical protein
MWMTFNWHEIVFRGCCGRGKESLDFVIDRKFTGRLISSFYSMDCLQNWDECIDLRKDRIMPCNTVFEFEDNLEIL